MFFEINAQPSPTKINHNFKKKNLPKGDEHRPVPWKNAVCDLVRRVSLWGQVSLNHKKWHICHCDTFW